MTDNDFTSQFPGRGAGVQRPRYVMLARSRIASRPGNDVRDFLLGSTRHCCGHGDLEERSLLQRCPDTGPYGKPSRREPGGPGVVEGRDVSFDIRHVN